MAQLEDNLGALDVEITDEDQARIDAVSAPGRAVAPYYGPETNAFLGPHKFRW